MDDAALVALARTGDQNAIETLLGRHENGVFTAALRLLGAAADAQDVAQEALVKAYLRLGDLDERASFGPWVRKIAINLSLNVLRRRGLLTFEPLERTSPDGGRDDAGGRAFVDTQTLSPEDSVLTSSLREEIDALVRQLPVEQRVAVVLRDMYGYEVSEIAESQRCGISAAKMRIARGRAHLRKLLTDARIDLGAVAS